MESVWSKTQALPEFPALEGNLRTDVLIIGGGIAGILCADQFSRAGIDYALVEADRICGGITKNTTAKITSQHGLIYGRLQRMFGLEKARMYYAANEAALERYRTLCRGIDCDFEARDAYVYSRFDREKIEKELFVLEKIGCDAVLCDHLPLPFPVAGAVRFKNQAQFHPLKFLSVLASGFNIYEHTKVLSLKPHTALTRRGEISAKHIVIATHFPILNKHGGYFLKLYQDRSYVLALKNAPDVNGMYVDEAEGGLSFRNYDGLLLLGGGGHRTGKTGGQWRALSQFTRQAYPEAAEQGRWATQDCMTLDGVPYIGRYARSADGLYVATGFNKWGMTSAMAAAMVLTDEITGKKSPYAPLFTPDRTMLRSQLAVNALEAATNLLSFSPKRCPHLGCALKWNAQEQTWDCPCHGSRFTQAGELIDNPATDDLKK